MPSMRSNPDKIKDKSIRLTTIKKSISIGAKGYGEKKVRKSTQGMPWLSEAMKDVISCDKLRGLANMN